MAFIVGKDCVDSISSDVNCTYPPTALGGTEFICNKGKGNIRYGNPQNACLLYTSDAADE